MSKIQQVNREVKARILAEDAATMKAVGRNYDAFYKSVAQSAKALAAQVKKLKAEGKDVQGRLFRLRQYNDMLRQFEADKDICCKTTAEIVKKAQAAAIAQGAADAQDLAFADMEDRQGDFAYIWNQPDNKAYENMVGYTEKGSPLVDVLKKHTQAQLPKIQEVLRTGMLRGDGPERIARRMRQIGWDDEKHAELVARTETMRCYRQSSLDSYEANSDVVEGVIWVCAHQARTCATCWAMDGMLFPLGTNVPNDHPNGRCTYLPKTKDVPGLDTGVEPWEPDKAFDQLTDEEQRRILGPKKYDKYKNQGFPLRAFATIKDNATWGAQVTGADPATPPVAPPPESPKPQQQEDQGTKEAKEPVKAVVPTKMDKWLRANGWDDTKMQELEDCLHRLPEPYQKLWNKYVSGKMGTAPQGKAWYSYGSKKISMDPDMPVGVLIHEAFHQVDRKNAYDALKNYAGQGILSNDDELKQTIRQEAAALTAGKTKDEFREFYKGYFRLDETLLRDRERGHDGIQDIIDGATDGKYLMWFGHTNQEQKPIDYDNGNKDVPYWKRYKDERDLPAETFANVASELARGGKGADFLREHFPKTIKKISDIIEKQAKRVKLPETETKKKEEQTQ